MAKQGALESPQKTPMWVGGCSLEDFYELFAAVFCQEQSIKLNKKTMCGWNPLGPPREALILLWPRWRPYAHAHRPLLWIVLSGLLSSYCGWFWSGIVLVEICELDF
jgi:hypothetical protein